jgi:hypothetical protein
MPCLGFCVFYAGITPGDNLRCCPYRFASGFRKRSAEIGFCQNEKIAVWNLWQQNFLEQFYF